MPGTATDPFPRDAGPKRVYEVKPRRAIRFSAHAAFKAGDRVKLNDERADGNSHLLALVEKPSTLAKTKPGAAGGKTRGLKAAKRG